MYDESLEPQTTNMARLRYMCSIWIIISGNMSIFDTINNIIERTLEAVMNWAVPDEFFMNDTENIDSGCNKD